VPAKKDALHPIGFGASAGEINTLQGNLNWVASREHSLSSPVWDGREADLLPLCNAAESDSANLDHVAELLVRTGTEPEESLMVLVPEAYRNHPDLVKNYPEVRASARGDPGGAPVKATMALHSRRRHRGSAVLMGV
jgi:glutamate synthase domain-containing protein 1